MAKFLKEKALYEELSDCVENTIFGLFGILSIASNDAIYCESGKVQIKRKQT